MKSLCAYSNALGKPGEGVHSYRVMNVAVVDVLMTLVAAYITHRVATHYGYCLTLSASLLLWFGAGFALHWLFCVNTTWTVNVLRCGKPWSE